MRSQGRGVTAIPAANAATSAAATAAAAAIPAAQPHLQTSNDYGYSRPILFREINMVKKCLGTWSHFSISSTNHMAVSRVATALFWHEKH